MTTERQTEATWHPWVILAGVIPLFAILAIDPPGGLSLPAWRTLGVVVLMAVWWVGQAMPIAATGLVPLVVFPLLGIVPIGALSANYANPIIFLFLGGFIIAKGMERWRVHKRIAVTILTRIGTRPASIVAGVMLAAGFLSMWVSNTATTAMMLPIGLSVIALLDPDVARGGGTPEHRNLALGIMLGLAYGANVGGIATLIGTPTNAILAAYLLEAHGISVGFGRWMMVGLPVSLAMLAICWLMLTRVTFPVGRAPIPGARALLAQEAASLGGMEANEKRVLAIFALVALLWLSRPLIQLAVPDLPLNDAAIGIAGALLMFLVPAARSGDSPTPRRALLTWEEARTVPWGICLLVGGGLALAYAMDKSGLARQIGAVLPGCDAWPLIGLIILVAAVVVFMTEVTTNAAMTAILLPVVGGLVGCGAVPIMVLAAPVALAASCAFMLPIATPPNAIVFGSGFLTIGQMARAGFLLNLASIFVVSAAAYVLVPLVF